MRWSERRGCDHQRVYKHTKIVGIVCESQGCVQHMSWLYLCGTWYLYGWMRDIPLRWASRVWAGYLNDMILPQSKSLYVVTLPVECQEWNGTTSITKDQERRWARCQSIPKNNSIIAWGLIQIMITREEMNRSERKVHRHMRSNQWPLLLISDRKSAINKSTARNICTVGVVRPLESILSHADRSVDQWSVHPWQHWSSPTPEYYDSRILRTLHESFVNCLNFTSCGTKRDRIRKMFYYCETRSSSKQRIMTPVILRNYW